MSGFKLDHAALGRMLKSDEIRKPVHDAAVAVAANISGFDGPVKVDDYTTDRAATSVTLADASGIASQAEHGTLTRAAAAAGFEVRSR